jgi:NAD(P)-dependent dehydrogenase (short-subunit alcohol dehydrogenase family)
MSVAVVTGASQGLGLSLARALAYRGWRLVIDARNESVLRAAQSDLAERSDVVAVPGDVTDPAHREALIQEAVWLGGIDLLVNNASSLGPSPLPPLETFPLAELERVFQVNVLAPLALTQAALPFLREGGVVINVSSDAAVEPYEGWGGYGSSKAALDQLTAVLGVEQPGLKVFAFDPGDMRTAMHQAAFPGEDISDRPEPERVVPALLKLIEGRLTSGRYRASDLLREAVSA